MLSFVVLSLVDDIEKLRLLHVADLDGVAFQVSAVESDLGRLIGKNGRTAKAIRTILSGSAAKNGRKYTLDLARVGDNPGQLPGVLESVARGTIRSRMK